MAALIGELITLATVGMRPGEASGMEKFALWFVVPPSSYLGPVNADFNCRITPVHGI
jgi:hypothetical protein